MLWDTMNGWVDDVVVYPNDLRGMEKWTPDHRSTSPMQSDDTARGFRFSVFLSSAVTTACLQDPTLSGIGR